MNRGTTWTPEMENTLIEMINSNISIEEIASNMGRTKNSILSRINIINKKMDPVSVYQNEAGATFIPNQTVDRDTTTDTSSSEEGTNIIVSPGTTPPMLHIGQTKLVSPTKPVDFTSILERIRGKKVLILDLETTGLVKDRANFFKYWDNKIYDGCRIVELGYWYSSSFDPDVTDLKINNYLRKPTDFNEIPQGAVDVHGISFEKAFNEGYTFNKIMINKKDDINNECLSFYEILNTIDVFISHNTAFDFYVLLNELNRIKQFGTIQRLMGLKKLKNVICTCKHSGYKRLGNIYKTIFNQDVAVAHRAGDDVKTLIEILIGKQLNTTHYICKMT